MRTWYAKTLLAAAVALVAAGSARADKIRLASGIGITGDITGIGSGGLIVKQGPRTQTVPLADIASVDVEKFPDMGRAESLSADGKATEAARLYEALLKKPTVPAWMRVLVQSRLYRTYAEARNLPKALDAYLEIAAANAELVAGLKLPSPVPGDAGNKAILAKVDAALKGAEARPYAKELQRLRRELVVETGSAAEAVPVLRQELRSGDPAKRLSALVRLVGLLVQEKKLDEARREVEAAAPGLEAQSPAQIAFLRAWILQEEKKPGEAALEYMRVPLLYPNENRALTAEALVRAGEEMEKADMPVAEVRTVYQKATMLFAGTTGAERAKRALVRLQGR